MNKAMKKIYALKYGVKRKIMAVMAVLMVMTATLSVSATDAYAGVKNKQQTSTTLTGYTGKSGTEIVEAVKNIFGFVSGFVGAVTLAASIFQLISAFKNEEVEGKHRAGLGIATGVAFLSMGLILGLVI